MWLPISRLAAENPHDTSGFSRRPFELNNIHRIIVIGSSTP